MIGCRSHASAYSLFGAPFACTGADVSRLRFNAVNRPFLSSAAEPVGLIVESTRG